MYAIVELGGRQWKVEVGSRLDINRLPAAVGAQHTVERVLLAHDGSQVQVGRPYVEGAKVICEVLEHRVGPKVISYHFRRRENWRKTVGHRQPLSRVVVKEIVLAGSRGSEPQEQATAPAEVQAPAAAKTRARKGKGASHGA